MYNISLNTAQWITLLTSTKRAKTEYRDLWINACESYNAAIDNDDDTAAMVWLNAIGLWRDKMTETHELVKTLEETVFTPE